MNKIASLILILGLGVALFLIFSDSPKSSDVVADNASNVEIRDGVQYVTVNAKGGYTPKISYAKAGIPTKLIMKTAGTFDCSAALVIREIDFQEILPAQGELEIDLGIPKVGEPITGLCSMGMYNFEIIFS